MDSVKHDTQQPQTVKDQWLEDYGAIIRDGIGFRTVAENALRNPQEAAYFAAVKLFLLTGDKNYRVGYLKDEGGYLFSYSLGTLEEFLKSEGRGVLKSLGYESVEYLDRLVWVPEELEGHCDIEEGDFFSLFVVFG